MYFKTVINEFSTNLPFTIAIVAAAIFFAEWVIVMLKSRSTRKKLLKSIEELEEVISDKEINELALQKQIDTLTRTNNALEKEKSDDVARIKLGTLRGLQEFCGVDALEDIIAKYQHAVGLPGDAIADTGNSDEVEFDAEPGLSNESSTDEIEFDSEPEDELFGLAFPDEDDEDDWLSGDTQSSELDDGEFETEPDFFIEDADDLSLDGLQLLELEDDVFELESDRLDEITVEITEEIKD